MIARVLLGSLLIAVGGCRPDTGEPDAGSDDAGEPVPGVLLGACGVSAGTPSEPFAILDLGHSRRIACLQKTEQSVVSVDDSGRFLLWRSADGARLASGATLRTAGNVGSGGCEVFLLTLRGETLAYVEPGGASVQVRSATTGASLATLVRGAKFGLANDGTSVWIASATGLQVFSPTGASLVSQVGDYSDAHVFADDQELLIARTGGLERLSLPGGTRTVLGSYSGEFYRWFQDGSHFFSTLGTTLWVYSANGTQLSIGPMSALASSDQMNGEGDWYWRSDERAQALSFFRLDGGATPVATRSFPLLSAVFSSGEFVGMFPYGDASFQIFHVQPTGITSSTVAARVPYLSSFGADPTGEWVVGAVNGSVWNGRSDGGDALPLGCGAPLAITGAGTGLMAIATASAAILLIDLRPDGGHTLRPSIPFYSSRVELSSDGRHLAAAGSLVDAQFWDDRSLRLYDPADGRLEHRWNYAWTDPTYFFDFSFAADGTRVSHLSGTSNQGQFTYTSLLSDTAGNVVATVPTAGLMLLSPDGVHGAVTTEPHSWKSTTQLFTNGVLSGAVQGDGVGWLSNDQLLVNVFRFGSIPSPNVFDRTEIRDAQGALVRVTNLPGLLRVRPFSSTVVYDTIRNSTWDLTTGQQLWSGFYPATTMAAPAGGFAVSATGPLIHAEQP